MCLFSQPLLIEQTVEAPSKLSTVNCSNWKGLMETKPTVLIIGGSSGIGQGIAFEFSQSNKFKIAILSSNNSKLQHTVKLCRLINPNSNILALQCDITNDQKLKSMITKCHFEFGPLTILINSAGVLYEHLINNTIDMVAVNKCIDVNLKGLINSCIFSVDYLKQTKKKYPIYPVSIININSISSLDKETDPKYSIYVASKFGVRGFTQCLFNELKEFGIKVVDISPRWINTPMVDQHNKDQNDQILTEQMMTVSDITKTIQYILDISHKAVPTQITLDTQYPARNPSAISKYIDSKL